MATKKGGVACYDNAAPDEPIFVIRAQDILGPEIVREWCHMALSAGTPFEKIIEARKCADQMEEWQIRNSKKVPD